MKVLQIGKFYPVRGGVEKVMYDLMCGLSERGIDCDMLCAAAEREKSGVSGISPRARLIAVPAAIKLASTMIAPAMVSKLREIKNDYDIVHIHHPDPMAALSLYLSGYRGKVVLHWHSDILKQRLLLKFYSPLQEWLIKRADEIVGTSPVYVRKSPFLKGVQYKTGYLPIGVDEIEPDENRAMAIRKKYGGRKIVFSLGRLVAYKGYEYLIRAFSLLKGEYVLLIGGSGPLEGELRALIKNMEMEDRAILLGRIGDGDLPSYFGACDLFCLPSVWKTEAFGIVQIEAMSCGKPIVATRIEGSGTAWVNKEGVSGLNVEPGNPEALARAIGKILGDGELYDTLSMGSRERYEALFTREKMTEGCMELYEKILSGKAEK